MVHRLHALACATLLGISPVATAADASTRSSDILAQQHAIRADMEAKRPRYANMPRDAQESVLADQQKLARLLEGKVDTSQLAAVDQAEVRRLGARIEATIRNNRGEGLVCTSEAVAGSDNVARVCRTATEIREWKEADEELLNGEGSRVGCADASGCP
jgi:cell division septum initiation protein DivIVA